MKNIKKTVMLAFLLLGTALNLQAQTPQDQSKEKMEKLLKAMGITVTWAQEPTVNVSLDGSVTAVGKISQVTSTIIPMPPMPEGQTADFSAKINYFKKAASFNLVAPGLFPFPPLDATINADDDKVSATINGVELPPITVGFPQ